MAFPVYIATLALLYSLGIGLWARYQLINFATSAARACAMTSPAVANNMQSCVSSYVEAAWQNAGVPCTGLNVQANASLNVGGSQCMKLLQVTLSCTDDWGDAFKGPIQIFGTTMGPTATTAPVSASASIPFLPAQSLCQPGAPGPVPVGP